jgi:phage shock protein A
MREETQQYPIDSRCKDCSLFQVVEEMKKKIEYLENKVASLKKELEQYRKKRNTRKLVCGLRCFLKFSESAAVCLTRI